MFKCCICQKEIHSEEVPPGWKQVIYTDGDGFGYCPDHPLVEVLNDIICRADTEIGPWCEIDEVLGSW